MDRTVQSRNTVDEDADRAPGAAASLHNASASPTPRASTAGRGANRRRCPA